MEEQINLSELKGVESEGIDFSTNYLRWQVSQGSLSVIHFLKLT